MFNDNKLLGNFRLDGIAAAARGLPQIEVTFDIDANGILHVSAKDKGTNKEQSISIEGSSGLSEEEIERAKKDAEVHAAEDEKRKEGVETRNQAESVVYQIEKQLGELGEALNDDQKKPVTELIEKVKEALKGDDTDAIKSSVSELEQLFAQAAQAAQAAGMKPEDVAGAAGATSTSSGDADSEGEPKQAKGKVVDAEVIADDK